jgi:hypothetical protein
MSSAEPIERIRKAHNLAVNAAKCWHAGSLAALEACLAALEESSAELRTAEATALGRPNSLQAFRGEIVKIKEEVARIEKLSDLAAAFLRGGGEFSGASPLYRAGGFQDSDTSSMPTTRIQA